MSSTGVLSAAAAAIDNGDLEVAEQLLESHLSQHADDVLGIELLAELAARRGRYNVAANLLLRCLQLTKDGAPVRQRLASVYLRAQRPGDALVEIDQVLAGSPGNREARSLRAAALARSGDYDGAISVQKALLAEDDRDASIWLDYSYALKKSGRTAESVKALRDTIARRPVSGDAWWAIASLKTERLSDADVAAMTAALDTPGLPQLQRAQLHYAMGKALEDRRRFDESFSHYATGAQLRRRAQQYDARIVEEHIRRSKAFFTKEVLAAGREIGSVCGDPIFIVGLPRSGSTLIEQILASHSKIEGTEELPDIGRIAKQLSERKTRAHKSKYPEVLGGLSGQQIKALGEDYVTSTRADRHTSKPMFTDKMPSNFLHIGLILLALPNAKIIDARRQPMAAGFSAFKQYFANGQAFTYDLDDIGRYYRAYLSLMEHFDRVAPGRVHRVIYEDMVSDTEAQVRRLLSYCGVDFEPACMRFFETDRVARTSSSEQVKQPIFTSAVEHWQNYEAWLDPLKQALGSALDAYPNVPPDLS